MFNQKPRLMFEDEWQTILTVSDICGQADEEFMHWSRQENRSDIEDRLKAIKATAAQAILAQYETADTYDAFSQLIDTSGATPTAPAMLDSGRLAAPTETISATTSNIAVAQHYAAGAIPYADGVLMSG